MATTRMTPRNLGGVLIFFIALFAVVWPWKLGTWVATHFMGADNPSSTRTLVGAAFMVPWVLILLFVVFRAWRKHVKYKAEVAAYNAVRPVAGPGGSTVYHHGGCTINHKTAEGAQKCTKGRA